MIFILVTFRYLKLCKSTCVCVLNAKYKKHQSLHKMSKQFSSKTYLDTSEKVKLIFSKKKLIKEILTRLYRF